MVMKQGQPPQAGVLGEMLEKITGMPSPDKVLVELQRLNTNMEKLAPDMHKIATAMDGLQAAKIGEAIKVLAEANKLIQHISDRIWGHK